MNFILAFIHPISPLLRVTSVHNITHLHTSSYTVLLHGRDQDQQLVCELFMNCFPVWGIFRYKTLRRMWRSV